MRKAFGVCLITASFLALLAGGCSRETDQAATAQPGTNAPMLIVPHLSVGKIRAGMTAQQLVSEIGEPRNKAASAYDYPQLGLAVMLKNGAVLAVLCGDVTGINGAYVKAFSGRTKEGIGLRSTREEIFKAYGPPAQAKGKPGALESLIYENVGITFNLEGDKVHHMILLLDGEQAPVPEAPEEENGTIKLNLGTPADNEDRR